MWVEEFLDRRVPVAREIQVWEDRMEIVASAFLTTDPAPLDLVTSVRTLVFRGDKVLLLRNEDRIHLLPGGRVEPGEAWTDALHREVLEEAGVGVRDVGPLGLVHFHHETPKPRNYAYPYPDFFHLVFVSCYASDRNPSEVDDYEVSAEFVPVSRISARVALGPVDLAFLRAARIQRDARRGE